MAGVNLTENLEYVLAHPAQSLRKLTLPHLPYLSAWVREQSPGAATRCTNIIAGDFIGADTLVHDVVRLNEKLLRGPCAPQAPPAGRAQAPASALGHTRPSTGAAAPGRVPAVLPDGSAPLPARPHRSVSLAFESMTHDD